MTTVTIPARTSRARPRRRSKHERAARLTLIGTLNPDNGHVAGSFSGGATGQWVGDFALLNDRLGVSGSLDGTYSTIPNAGTYGAGEVVAPP